jgi:hypothetical protein
MHKVFHVNAERVLGLARPAQGTQGAVAAAQDQP